MPPVRVRLETDGLRLEFEGGEALFDRAVMPLVLGLAGGRPDRASGNSATCEARASGDPAAPARPIEEARPTEAGDEIAYRPPPKRFGTFRRQLDPAQNGAENRIAAFAFFLWNYERKEVFQEEEVLGCFLAEGAELPTDSAPLYESLAKNRLLSRGEEDGFWKLTSKGRAHVRHHLLSA